MSFWWEFAPPSFRGQEKAFGVSTRFHQVLVVERHGEEVCCQHKKQDQTHCPIFKTTQFLKILNFKITTRKLGGLHQVLLVEKKSGVSIKAGSGIASMATGWGLANA